MVLTHRCLEQTYAHERYAPYEQDRCGIGWQAIHQRHGYDGYLSGQYRQLFQDLLQGSRSKTFLPKYQQVSMHEPCHLDWHYQQ